MQQEVCGLRQHGQAIETNHTRTPVRSAAIVATRPRWREIDGIRGLAAILVFLVHYTALIRPHLDAQAAASHIINFLGAMGHVGADLFFVISGFLMYQICLKADFDFKTYLFRRMQRIYPAFLAVLVLYVITMSIVPTTNKLLGHGVDDAWFIVANVLLLPGIFPIAPMISPTWSLSYEALYYLTLPCAVLALGIREWRPGKRVAAALVVMIALCAGKGLGFTVHIRMSMFLAGIILYEIIASRQLPTLERPAASRGAEFAFFSVLIATLWSFNSFRFQLGHEDTVADVFFAAKYFWLAMLFIGFVYLCLHFKSRASALANCRALQTMGYISYSFFLFHSFALHVLAKVWTVIAPSYQVGVAGFSALFLPALALSVAMSLPLFLLVEVPFSLDFREADGLNRERSHAAPANAVE